MVDMRFDLFTRAQTSELVRMAGEVDRLQRQLNQLDRTRVRVPVDIDTSAVEKLGKLKLAGLGTAIAAGLGVGAPAVLAASTVLFAGVAAVGVMSAQRIRSAYVDLGHDMLAGLQSDASVLIPTFVGLADKIGASFERLRPQLGKIFTDVGPQVETLVDGITQLAERAMPGLVTAVDRANPVLAGLAKLLASTGTGISGLFTELSNSSAASGQVLVSLGQIIQQLLPFVGHLLAVIAQFTTGALPMFGSVLGVVLDALTGLLNVLGPIAPMIGSLTGVLLTGVAAWKLFGAAGVAVAGLGPKLASLGLAAGVMTEQVTGSATAGQKLADGAAKAEGVLSKLGRALPFIGVALVALDLAFQQARGDVEQWAQGLIQGGDAALRARAEFEAHNAQFREGSILGNLFRKSQADLNGELERQIGIMPPLEAVQARAALAQTAYNDAVRLFGETSGQATAAQQAMALANARVTAEQERSAAAHRTTTQEMRFQQDEMFKITNASLGLEGALLNQESAQIRAKEALAQHGAQSLIYREAALAVKNADLQVSQATADKQRADQDATGSVGQHTLALLGLAEAGNGPARNAIRTLIGNLSDEQAQALISQAATQGLAVTIERTPSGKIINISVQSIVSTALAQQFSSGTGRGASTFGLARGGVLAPMDDGGVLQRFASGGLNPMSGARAQIVAPNTWRVIGDNVSYPEVFAPLDGSARSLSFLRYGVRKYGLDIVAQQDAERRNVGWARRVLPMADGGIVGRFLAVQETGLKAMEQTAIRLSAPAIVTIAAKLMRDRLAAMVVPGGTGGGSGRWAGVVLQALRIMGQPASLLGTVLRRLNQESGGNASVVNRWDINARRGTPSVGLMQVIGPTYRAYRFPGYDVGPYIAGTSINPLANILASMRYALARYGSLAAAYNRRGGYANGGIVSSPTFGLLGESGPEAVVPLNRPRRAAEVMRAAGIGPDASLPVLTDIRREISRLRGEVVGLRSDAEAARGVGSDRAMAAARQASTFGMF